MEYLHTPPISSSMLSGLTRDAVITLAGEMGFRSSARSISLGKCYT